jgi:hypothetical protein
MLNIVPEYLAEPIDSWTAGFRPGVRRLLVLGMPGPTIREAIGRDIAREAEAMGPHDGELFLAAADEALSRALTLET